MATDVTGDTGSLLPAVQPPAEPPAPASPTPSAREQHWPHRFRFLAVYGLLGLALGGAIAGVAVYASRSIHPAPAWSAWRPHGGGQGAAKEIAAHVGAAYKLPGGSQLVDVIAKAPSVSPGKTAIPIHYVAIRGAKGSQYQTFDVSPSDSVMYSLCGLGPSCAIATGTASVARGRLVRREILELALYTFKYVPGMQSVIAFMPPKPGSQPQYVALPPEERPEPGAEGAARRHAAVEDAAPERHPGARGPARGRGHRPEGLLVQPLADPARRRRPRARAARGVGGRRARARCLCSVGAVP